ncbi:hypothetical protein GLAREA_01141 [Glarea lozoyensis ATCC 20868]|uniref:Uncharacterized protein n=1 Tax=Glarea lozoyensis (strain ATCC 20868 / MF5171) TaxID=1116229 RepID=S3DDB2_GLAL2|nr:uncharacterized protein GLAREA_01141 [Glarea lozoyensis ATCC 20868]EPE29981.1 hypothetical protein GLAREA_01141 [Glarea lozoyensis ATCC 20868]
MKSGTLLALPAHGSDRSDLLHPSSVPANRKFRSFFLEAVRASSREEAGTAEFIPPPPLISCSDFVPRPLVELLMRKKKNGALGVKWVKGDELTNMEGAMHTFVTPVISKCEMNGDYRYNPVIGGHGVDRFGDVIEIPGTDGNRQKYQLTRSVVLSASIQMDFENGKVMLNACMLEESETIGVDLLSDSAWVVLEKKAKQDDKRRRAYDETLKRHMIYHLTASRTLPARKNAKDLFSIDGTIQLLESFIKTLNASTDKMVGVFTSLDNRQIVSIEFLFNTALEQVRNEIAALEFLCTQGYVYTYDPASIFARKISAKILNRLMLAALKHLSDQHKFANMRVFGFNDYADKNAINLAHSALRKQEHVVVTSKQDLFNGTGGMNGLYNVAHISQAVGAMLVIHNNSDGFGQNIETEAMTGSLDGAIGSSSSAAASLERSRENLLDFVW